MQMKYNEHTPLRTLLADPRAVAVIEKHMPGATAHPQLDQALDLSLRILTSYPEANLTPDKLAAIMRDLEQL
jgi:hypothetical protein